MVHLRRIPCSSEGNAPSHRGRGSRRPTATKFAAAAVTLDRLEVRIRSAHPEVERIFLEARALVGSAIPVSPSGPSAA